LDCRCIKGFNCHSKLQVAVAVHRIFSVGVTLWEIFSLGQAPYSWLSQREAFAKIPKGERLHKPETCPHSAYELMIQCWDLDPSKRPSFIEIVERIKLIMESFEMTVSGFSPVLKNKNENINANYYSYMTSPNSTNSYSYSSSPNPTISNSTNSIRNSNYHNT